MRAERWSPPKELAEYRLSRLLGTGAMGQVYLAHDTVLDRAVAIKFIAALDPSSALRERFLVEARAIARIQHPNVVSIYRVGELDDRPYLISEFIRGESLDKLEKPVAWTRALELGIGLARGLAAAHRRGVLHRDIKTANAILADNGDVKLVDFGLAKLVPAHDPAQGRPLDTRDFTTHDLPARALPREPSIDLGPLRRTADPRTTVRPDSARPDSVRPDSARLDSARPATSLAITRRPETAEPSPLAVTRPSESAPAPGAGGDDPGRGPPALAATNVDAVEEKASTNAGGLMGTPFYLAPELWAGHAATRRSDVYSLGVLLYELCTGNPPFSQAESIEELGARVQNEPVCPVREVVPAMDPRFAAVIDRCLSRAPEDRFGSGDELRDALEQISLRQSALAAAIPEGNPYRGLAAFEREHRALFFGRGTETRAVLERLRHEAFILVTGDSGVGKSSLCRAGILPLLEEGALEPGRAWSVATFVPGPRPLDALAEALAPHLPEGTLPPRDAEPAVWTEHVSAAFRARHENAAGLVVFVDQLEELTTLADPGEAGLVTELLVHLATTLPSFRVLATVRGDHLTRVASLPGLVDEIPRALFLLGPLSPRGIREAITGPAEAKGVRFESEHIVEALAAAGARAEGGLPLVQFALAELWESQDPARHLITRAALDTMGGVEGALARHADAVLAALLPAQRRAAERMFVRLVTSEGTKARRTTGELGRDRDSTAALEALVRGRLLVAREQDDETAYELAHEALIKSWPTLRGWLERNSDARLVLERLGRAAAEWERLDHASDALWVARQLHEAALLHDADVAPRERAFLDASRRAVRRRHVRRAATFALVPLVLAASYGGVRAKLSADLAKKVAVQVDDADRAAAFARAKDEEVRALEADAYAAFDAQSPENGEAIWARASSGAREVDERWGRAAQSLEAALALDGSRVDVRAKLADALFQRALVAEREERTEHVPELLRRLAVHDVSGTLLARFHGKVARVSITSTPPGATVTLERAGVGGGGTSTAPSTTAPSTTVPSTTAPSTTAPSDTTLGATPLEHVALEPGSWVLVFSLPGRVTVRHPLHVAHDEVRTIAVELPRAGEVPEGFVYVPPGRFLFGSTADEELRRDFFNTAPLHAVETAAFSIARYETTYADWIEFLKTLPPKERRERTPRLDGGFARGLDLVELPSVTGSSAPAWQLTIQPAQERYVVASGQPLRYAGRTRHAVQDWLRFPVSGISVRDAEAYVAWLDASGRVPGARLCTDLEWERAARGADRRSYPHGDAPEPDDFNFDETYGRSEVAFGPDEVGSHPASRSPFGVDDLAGNVWELVRSSMHADEWVARGGSYHQARKTCRTMNREVIGEPTIRDLTLGLRVCASMPASAEHARAR